MSNHEAYITAMLRIEYLEKLRPVENSKDYNELQNLYREVREYERKTFG